MGVGRWGLVVYVVEVEGGGSGECLRRVRKKVKVKREKKVRSYRWW